MPTILVVDDDSVDRELASRCLAPIEDLETLYAQSGNEALEAIANRPFDLVLTDLRMPGMDGLELVERVTEEFPLLPILLMTSQGSEQIAVRALKAGAASYVPKSDLKDSLAETVEQVLEVAEARRSRHDVLKYLGSSETRFELINDPALISPLVGYFRDSLERIGFASESVRTQVGMALMEALSNAMIHGNLEVGSELRKDSTRDYYRLIEQRREEQPYAGRRVTCTASATTGTIACVVEDEGPGFDPSSLPDPTAPENLVHVQGRGLFLIRTFMDDVEFNDKGNRITMTKRHEGAPRAG